MLKVCTVLCILSCGSPEKTFRLTIITHCVLSWLNPLYVLNSIWWRKEGEKVRRERGGREEGEEGERR